MLRQKLNSQGYAEGWEDIPDQPKAPEQKPAASKAPAAPKEKKD